VRVDSRANRPQRGLGRRLYMTLLDLIENHNSKFLASAASCWEA
jgi:hypothetical protein